MGSAQALVEVARSGSLEATMMFLESYPESVKEANEITGRLPLHELLMGWEDEDDRDDPSRDGRVGDSSWRTVNVGIAAYLIRLFPRSLALADYDGNTPLHCVVQREGCSSSLELFRLVYDGAQCVSGFCNDKGQRPIHVAIEHGCLQYAMYLLKEDYCMLSRQKLDCTGSNGDRSFNVLDDGTVPSLSPEFHATMDAVMKLTARSKDLFDASSGCEPHPEDVEPS